MKLSHRLLFLALGAGLAAAPLTRAEDTGSTPAPSSAPAPATATPRQERRHERREYLAQELGLTDDQKAKMKALNEQEGTAIKAVRADASLNKDQRRAKIHDIMKNFQTQRDALLTPDQQKKAAELREQAKEHRQHRADATPAPNGK